MSLLRWPLQSRHHSEPIMFRLMCYWACFVLVFATRKASLKTRLLPATDVIPQTSHGDATFGDGEQSHRGTAFARSVKQGVGDSGSRSRRQLQLEPLSDTDCTDDCICTTRRHRCSCDHLTCRTYDTCCQSIYDGHNNVTAVERDPRVTRGSVSCITGSSSPLFNYKVPMMFSMVTGCPSDSAETISDLCAKYDRLTGNLTFYQLPVFGKESKILYANYYCGLCNGEQRETIVYWNGRENCAEVDVVPLKMYDEMFREHSSRSESLVEARKCWLKFLPPDDYESYVSHCGIDSCLPSWNNTDVAARCRSDVTSFVYSPHRKRYRNGKCAICNDDFHNWTAILEVVDRLESPALSILINFNDLSHNSGSYDMPSNFECPIGQFWDPFRTTCASAFHPPTALDNAHHADRSEHVHHQQLQRLPRVHDLGEERNQSMGDVEPKWTLNCSSLISYNESEYKMNEYGEVTVLSRPDVRYRTGDYFIHDSKLVVCNPFERTPLAGALDPEDPTRILTLIGVVLSLILLLMLLIVYSTHRVLRNVPGKCLMSLVTSLFVGKLLLMFAFNWHNASHVICTAQAVLMHYSWLAAFMWMNVLSFDIFRTFNNSPSAASSAFADKDTSRCCPPGRFAKYSFYAWTIPALLVIASLSTDLLGDPQSKYRPRYATRSINNVEVCWINSPRGLLVFFGAPIGLILMANSVLYAIAAVNISRATAASRPAVRSSSHKQLLVLYVKLFVVMGLTWSFGFLATLTGWTAAMYLFTILNSLQGAFIALAFLSTRQVRPLLRQSACWNVFVVQPLQTRHSVTHSTNFIGSSG